MPWIEKLLHAHNEDVDKNCAEAQADFSLRWMNMSEGTLFHVAITKTRLFKYIENFTSKN